MKSHFITYTTLYFQDVHIIICCENDMHERSVGLWLIFWGHFFEALLHVHLKSSVFHLNHLGLLFLISDSSDPPKTKKKR